MLVLSRKKNESIVIGGGINVTIVAIGSQRVKIGIEAPPEVSIVRHELLAGDDVHEADEAADRDDERCDDVPPSAGGSPLTSRSSAQADMLAPGA